MKRLRVFLGISVLSACAGSPPPHDGAAQSEPPAPVPTASQPELVDAAAPIAITLDASSPDAASPNVETDAPAAVSDDDDLPPPPPAHQRYKPVGGCVDPMKHAMRQMHGPAPAKSDEFRSEPRVSTMDLDADGQEDQLLIGDVANITTTYYAYVMRGACGHFAGKITAEANLRPVGPYSKGLLSLGGLAACQPSCCKTLMYSEYRYDGTRYKLLKKESRQVSDCPFGE